MKKQNLILSTALAAVFSSSVAFAEAEVTGKFTYEGAAYTESGSTIGDMGKSTPNYPMGVGGPTQSVTKPYHGVTNATTPSHGGGDQFKSEASARIFIDGEADELSDGATYHVELNLMRDSEGITNYDSNESYTQRDPLREAYIDSTVGDWSLRTGKQQVVWGTADGMKLLDTINPTDYGEMAQNQMEDSRIPVWMINAETTTEDGSEFQMVVSQPKENVFAGLNRNISTHVRKNTGPSQGLMDDTMNEGTDSGHAFMMMGPDSITGASNGFLNIVPDLGSVASQFGSAFTPNAATTSDDLVLNLTTGGYTLNGGAPSDANSGAFNAAIGAGGLGHLEDATAERMSGFTVNGFSGMTMKAMDGALNAQGFASETAAASGTGLSYIPPGFRRAIGNTFMGLITKFGGDPTLAAATTVNQNARTAIIAHYNLTLDNAGSTPLTQASLTADQLTGAIMLDVGFGPLYSSNLSSLTDGTNNSAFDYMGNTTFRTFNAFVDARSQYVYDMPDNTDADVAFRYKNTTKDGVNYSLNASYNYDKNPIIGLSWRGDKGQLLTTHKVINYRDSNGVPTTTSSVADTINLQLVDTAVATYNATKTNHDKGYYTAGSTTSAALSGLYGAADGLYNPATLRFTQSVERVKQIGGSFDTAIETAALGPVVIRGEALYTMDGYSPVMNKDKLAYGDLVGALEMVKADRFKFVLGADITALTNMMVSAQYIQDSNLDFIDNGNHYTTDYATMHLSNGFNKAIEDKKFYSLFFSKPFGASGEHRWNNISMLEEGLNGNGKWNRLDAEFSIDDDTQVTAEWNKYWGDANTQFGQLEKSSNIQVGFKYSF